MSTRSLSLLRNYDVLNIVITKEDVDVKYQLNINGEEGQITSFTEDSVSIPYHEQSPMAITAIEVYWYDDEEQITRTISQTYVWFLEGHILLKSVESTPKYLPLLYNPEVTNLKWNYSETITPTLGGAYPIVTRNGNQRYRTFTLGGMLSYELDLPINNLFSGYQFITQTDIDSCYELTHISKNEQNLILEQRFRDRVIAWLQNGQPKIFMSETEGAIKVVLTGFSWTGNKTLGRHGYSFSCTATEIGSIEGD